MMMMSRKISSDEEEDDGDGDNGVEEVKLPDIGNMDSSSLPLFIHNNSLLTNSSEIDGYELPLMAPDYSRSNGRSNKSIGCINLAEFDGSKYVIQIIDEVKEETPPQQAQGMFNLINEM